MCSPHLETHSINCKPLCSPRELPSFALVGVYIPPPANNRLTRCHPRNYRQQCHTRDLNTLDHCYLSRPHAASGLSDQCLLHLILTCRQKLKTFKPVVRIVRKWTDESKLELQAWIHWLCDLTSVFVRTCMWGPSTEEAHRTLPSTGDHPPPYGKPTTIRWPEHLLPPGLKGTHFTPLPLTCWPSVVVTTIRSWTCSGQRISGESVRQNNQTRTWFLPSGCQPD